MTSSRFGGAMALWLGVLTLLALGGCNNDQFIPGIRGQGGEGGFTPISVCQEEPVPAGCGEPCGRDTDCAAGTHCSGGSCDAVCTAVAGCDAQSVCSPRGRCDRLSPEGGTGGTTGCMPEEVFPSRIVPNVMFLVDRSGSMHALLDGTWPTINNGNDPNPTWVNRRNMGERTRWEVAHDAIASVLTGTEDIVEFGLSTYSGTEINNVCPGIVAVDIGPSNASNILATYLRTEMPGGRTPTAASIDATVSRIQANPGGGDGDTIIVLATDGEPNSCGSSSTNRGPVETAVSDAFGEQILTFVLSVGSDVGQDHLQRVANLGLGKSADETGDPADFWVGTSPEALEQAFQTIVRRQVSCDINLNGLVENRERVCEADIRLDGAPLGCGTDWQLHPGNDSQIQLLGSACDQWKTGDANISAVFPCGILGPG